MIQMRKHTISAMITIALCALLISASAAADELRLKNGDRLTGKIISMEADKLVFTTSYAGKLEIAWGEIEYVSTDEPLKVRLSDGTMLKGTVESPEAGTMVVRPEEETRDTVALSIAEVAAINQAEKPRVACEGHVNVGVTENRGNTEDWKLHGEFEVVARVEKNRFTVGGELDREEKTKKKRDGGDGKSHRTEDYVYGHWKYDRFLNDTWYLYNNASAESDDMAYLDLRTMIGIGVGYQVFDTESTRLSFEGGPTYVSTDYDEPDDDEDYGAGRWAVRFEQRLFDNFVTLFHNHVGDVRLDDANNMFIKFRSGIRIPTYRKFNLTIQYNVDWDRDAAENATGTDTKTITSLGYSW